MLLCFQQPSDAQSARLLTMTEGIAQVVTCPYEEQFEIRNARGRGDLDEACKLGGSKITPEQRSAFERAEVILSVDLPMELGSFAKDLRWVQAVGAGTDFLCGAGLPKDVTVTNGAGIAAVPIAEFVFARVLAILKRVPELESLQRTHTWTPTYGRQLGGTTMGIVGFGAIGQAVARRAKAFDMRVLAIRRNPQPDPLADEVHGPEALQAILPDCDVVVLAAPSTPKPETCSTPRCSKQCSLGQSFRNVARGALVDEGALVAALRSGHVGAAILDVTEQEPLPSASLLWDCPKPPPQSTQRPLSRHLRH